MPFSSYLLLATIRLHSLRHAPRERQEECVVCMNELCDRAIAKKTKTFAVSVSLGVATTPMQVV